MTSVKISRSALILAAAIAAVAAISLLLLFTGPKQEPQSVTYNGFEFVKGENSWFTEWEREGQMYDLEFRHPPWEVEDIKVNGDVDISFQRQTAYITFDPPEAFSKQNSFLFLASADITSQLVTVFERDVVSACTANETAACAGSPVITCSSDASVIYLKTSNETGIFLEGNCATIQGSEDDIVRAADRALFEWLGIMR